MATLLPLRPGEAEIGNEMENREEIPSPNTKKLRGSHRILLVRGKEIRMQE